MGSTQSKHQVMLSTQSAYAIQNFIDSGIIGSLAMSAASGMAFLRIINPSLNWKQILISGICVGLTFDCAILSAGELWTRLKTNLLNNAHKMCYNSISMSKRETLSYTDITKEVIEYIKSLNMPVVKMCAGNEHIANILRQEGIGVHAFDKDPLEQGGVKFGLAGEVEKDYGDHILLITAGFDVEKSVDAYEGNTVILGGNLIPMRLTASYNVYKIHNKHVDLEKVHNLDVHNPTCMLDTSIKDPCYFLIDVRVKYERMINLGYTLVKTFLVRRGSNESHENDTIDTTKYTYQVYQVWQR